MPIEREHPRFIENIYHQYERLMYYIAGKYVTAATQREDIVQTAMLSLLRNETTLQQLSPHARVSYIVVTVRNAAINMMRRAKKESARCVPFGDLDDDLTQYIPSAENKYFEKERQQELLATFRRMKADEQKLLMGKYLMDMTDTELAELLGCKPSSIRMKLTRARRIFMMEFQKGGIIDE